MFLSESCCFPLFVKGESLLSVSIVNLQKNGTEGFLPETYPRTATTSNVRLLRRLLC